MNKSLFLKHIATQGAIGYGTAPGTMATLMAMPVVYILGRLDITMMHYAFFALLLFVVSFFVAHHALSYFDMPDPDMIVVDEMAAFVALFIGLPTNIYSIMVGFVLFRLFDIFKPFGIAYCEKLPGAAGVMLDDIAAAGIAHLCMRALIYYGVL